MFLRLETCPEPPAALPLLIPSPVTCHLSLLIHRGVGGDIVGGSCGVAGLRWWLVMLMGHEVRWLMVFTWCGWFVLVAGCVKGPCSTSHSPTDSQGIPEFRKFLKKFQEFQEYGYSPNNSRNSWNLHKQDSEFLALYFHLWGLDGVVVA